MNKKFLKFIKKYDFSSCADTDFVPGTCSSCFFAKNKSYLFFFIPTTCKCKLMCKSDINIRIPASSTCSNFLHKSIKKLFKEEQENLVLQTSYFYNKLRRVPPKQG